MERFRRDNTEGYDAAELAELNRRFEARIADIPEDDRDPSVADYIAERVQAEFDNETPF